MRKSTAHLCISIALLFNIASIGESFVPAVEAVIPRQEISESFNISRNQLSRQATDGVLFHFALEDIKFMDANRVPFQEVYTLCAPTGSTREQLFSYRSWRARMDTVLTLRDCVLNCLDSTYTGTQCSIEEYKTIIYEDTKLKICLDDICSAITKPVSGFEVSTGIARNDIGIFALASPSPSPSPTATVTPIAMSPTPSPIRKPEDFILEPTAEPKEVGRVVGNIVEEAVEAELDEAANIKGSDVSVKIKISQKKGNNEIKESDGSLLAVSRPVRYCLPNRNCAVRVIVTSPVFIEKLIIQRAANKLRNSPNFSQIFKTSRTSLQIRRKKNGNKYVVVAEFKDSYLGLFR